MFVFAAIEPELLACKCPQGVSVDEQVEKSAVIAEATATEVTRSSTLGISSSAKFNVSKVWKGAAPASFRIEWKSTCDYDSFSKGVAYLLILSRRADGSFEASKCWSTKPLELAAKELTYLKKTRKPRRPNST